MPEERFLSTEEVAEKLQVDEQTVRRWIKSGKLEAVKPGREWRIPPNAFEALLESYSSPKAQTPLPLEDSERGTFEDVWKEQYLAHVNKMLDKWEDELEEKLALAESDLVRFFEWLEEVREYGRPLMSGVVSGYTATSGYRLEAVANAARFLGPWDDLWLRIEERIDQTTTFSEEDAQHFRELREEARAVQ